MAIYTVLEPPATSGLLLEAGAEFIPDTKALLALALPLPWLLWHRMWWGVVFYLLVSTIFAIALTTEFAILVLATTFIPGLFLFLEGNELRRKALLRRNWKEIAVVEGDTLESAETRFFYARANNLPKLSNTSQGQIKPLKPDDSGIGFLSVSESR